MSLQNLKEDSLYSLLPEGIITLDEQLLIQAVVGGYQDRVDDLRAYTSKLELLVTGVGLPETDANGNPTINAVIAQVQSPKGVVYNRSLEIQDDTPADGDPALLTWVAGQLQLDEDHVLISAAYGIDPLRLVDANVLAYLATTVGAVLYQTAAMDPTNQDSDARRLLQTWFPRLQFKGTAQSFETLGRLLGFDDVRMTPLWSRLSLRQPNDIGSGTNIPDFATVPDFYPKQTRDNFYDPWDLTDGPYYEWAGTASARFGTNSTQFYTQSINGFNPFFTVAVVGPNPTDPNPALSPYVLTGGGPEVKASVSPSGTGLMFQAISEGDSFNGMAVNVLAINGGTQTVLSVNERLSSIKYRSSFYDLGMTVDFDKAEKLFGTNVVQPSPDLAANPTLANLGTAAISPFRPWTSGSLAQGTIERDWVWEIDVASTQVIVSDRTQADLTDRQLNESGLTAAGIQVVQAMEEVRPATRQARVVNSGYLNRDNVGYADYVSTDTLLTTTSGVQNYYGTLVGYPLPPYAVEFQLLNVLGLSFSWNSIPGATYEVGVAEFGPDYGLVIGTVTATGSVSSFVVLVGGPYASYGPFLNGQFISPQFDIHFVTLSYDMSAEASPTDPNFVNLSTGISGFTGTFNYSNATWKLNSAQNYFQHGILFVANWQPTSTEVVRPNPPSGDVVAYQARPEDQLDDPIMDLADEYPWRRDLVGGGEVVDYDSYSPSVPDAQTVPLGATVAVVSQTGAQYDVTVNVLGDRPPRFEAQERSLAPYVPGQKAIAYSGTFYSLDAAPTVADNDLDLVFQPGWQLYHFGLVQGVLVADPPKFFGPHHRDGLALWLPFNEHPEDTLIFNDHSPYATNVAPANMLPEDRLYDPARGRYATIRPNVVAVDATARGLSENGQMALGFWLRAINAFSAEEIFLLAGPLSVSLKTVATVPTLTIYAESSGTPVQLVQFAIATEWVYVGMSFDGISLSVGYWTTSGGSSVYSAALPQAVVFDDAFALMANGTQFDIQDLRLWNTTKLVSQLDLAHYHQPTPTAVLYRPAFLQSLNSYDHWGVRVLPSGFVVPDLLPSTIETPALAWVSRYEYTGQYEGQSRYKEVGLGSGNMPPVTQNLGAQWNTMTGAGTAVASTWGPGGFLGMNGAWAFDNPTPNALRLVEASLTPNGIPDTRFNTGTSSPWPNPLQATNPCRDRIWVQGDDGYVYEITVVSTSDGGPGLITQKLFNQRTDAELKLSGTYNLAGTLDPILQIVPSYGYYAGAYYFHGTTSSGTIYPEQLLIVAGTVTTTDDGAWGVIPSGNVFAGQVLPSKGTYTIEAGIPGPIKVYHPKDLLYADQPTGAEVALTNTTFHNQLRVDTSGNVYAAAYAGTLMAAPIYIYGNENVQVDLSGQNLFNVWTDPSSFGFAHAVPSLQAAGEISLEISQAMPSGYYRMEVTSGNIGQADVAFNGFSVVVTVGDTSFQATLCKGQSGANFSATDTLDFYLPHALPGSPASWLLTFDWLNSFTDVRHGTARQLAISAVKVIQLASTLYELQMTNSGSSLAPVSTTSADFPSTPGGWLTYITSWGTLAGVTHESKIYSGNDTLQSDQPYSNVLTSTTVERREDLVLNGSYQPVDVPNPALPAYSTITIT